MLEDKDLKEKVELAKEELKEVTGGTSYEEIKKQGIYKALQGCEERDEHGRILDP